MGARLPSDKMEATLVATCASSPSTPSSLSHMDESNDSGLEDDDNLKGQYDSHSRLCLTIDFMMCDQINVGIKINIQINIQSNLVISN